MKKLIGLTFLVLLTAIFMSCARVAPKPGIKVGTMTVEEHATLRNYPDLRDYCGEYSPQAMTPGTQTIDCEVPLLPRIQTDFGWGAKDSTTLDSNWSAMTWELYLDGQQINLDEFEQWSRSGRTLAGNPAQGRGWTLDLVDLSPGEHILRLLWRSETPIDDGFDIYPPGTYESDVNFTVLEQ